MKTKAKSIILLGAAFTFFSNGLEASAVTLYNSWGQGMTAYPGSPMYKIPADDGKTYTVPYVKTFRDTEATKNKYNYYSSNNRTNAFFRNSYGWVTPYQPIPSNAVRVANDDSYSWADLYESNPANAPYKFRNNFFETSSVKENTVNCGYLDTDTTLKCYGSTANLNPDGVNGHTHYNSGVRDDGTFGGKGTWGEVRFLGYSEAGNIIDNTYFIMDNRVNHTPADYPYDDNIWNLKYKVVNKTTYDTDPWRGHKLDAITKLLKQEGMSGKAEDWLDRLSLQTNPMTDAPVFLATRDNGKGYHVLVVRPSAAATMNVGITSMRLYDKEENLVAGVVRDKIGTNDLTVDFAGKELNQRPKLDPSETYKLEIVVQNGSEKATNISQQEIVVDGKTYTKCGSLAAGKSCTFEIDYQAPEKGGGEVQIDAKVSDTYLETGDNQNHADDNMSVKVAVNKAPQGDVALNNVYLVEAKTNKVVEHPIQGVEYYLQFKGTYIGESMKGNELSFKVKADITTSVPQNGGGTAESTKTYYTIEIKTKLPASSKDEPKTFEFKTNTFKATSSTIKVDATLIGPSDFKWTYNTNTKNDKVDKTWTAPINLTLSQVTLDPSSHPGGDYCGTVTVNYWVDFTLAYNMTNRPAEVQKVQVAFYANGNYVTSDTIKVYAKQGKRQYSFQLNLNGNCIEPGESIKVIVNPTHKLSESTMDDNSKSVNWNSKYPEGYCETNPKDKLTWKQEYLNLSLIENGYGVNVDQVDSANKAFTENYEKLTITKIEMRSKLMTDKKMGPNQDGWVDALNPGNDKIQIKAGYGFDVRVTVEYETNAYIKESKLDIPISQLYTPLKPLNLTDNLFIKLDGDGTNLISLNTEGIKLERPNAQPYNTGNVTKVTWTYTIAERLSPNGTNQMVDSLFINENTKDGKYKINLYTLPLFGVPGKTPKDKDSDGNFIQYDPICANAEIEFEVKGSVYDDLEIGLIK